MRTVKNTPKFNFKHYISQIALICTEHDLYSQVITFTDSSRTPIRPDMTPLHVTNDDCYTVHVLQVINTLIMPNKKRQRSHVQYTFIFLELIFRILSAKMFVPCLNIMNCDISDMLGKYCVGFND